MSGHYDAARSRVLRLTTIAWAVLVLGLAGGLGIALLMPRTAMDADQRELVDLAGSWQGGLLGLLAVLLAAGVQGWAFQRRHEVEPLV